MTIDKEKIVSELAKITNAIQEISKALEPEVKVIKQTCYNCKYTKSCTASEIRPSEGCDVWKPQTFTMNIIKAREVDPTQSFTISPCGHEEKPEPVINKACSNCGTIGCGGMIGGGHVCDKWSQRYHTPIFNDKLPVPPHLCDTCIYTYPECNAWRIIWGIELNPKAKGKEADSVVVCSKYTNRVT